MVKEGDMVMAPYEEGEVHIGRIVHVMRDGMLGFPGSEYLIMASEEDPAVLIQLFEMEDGGLKETEYFVGHKASEVMAMPSLESNVGMDKSMDNSVDEEDDEMDDEMDKQYKGCGCPTCKELNVDCPNCPVCQGSMDKAKKPNYEEMIQPRRGGSTPANPRLYAAVVQAAKDKFDVYPSAVANGWVVQEYKRRGGTYKMEDTTTKGMGQWSGSIFDLNPFVK
jgi:hypothetical protein